MIKWANSKCDRVHRKFFCYKKKCWCRNVRKIF